VNLAQLLSVQAAERPYQAALIDARRKLPRRISFAELELASARAARLLEASGLRPGDAVLVFQPMSIELYIALAAIFRTGLVAMFLDPRTGRGHIEQCCALWPPRALIACPAAHLLRVVSPALRRVPLHFSVGPALPWTRSFLDWDRSDPRLAIAPCEETAPALVTFTSGSTGQAKAALRSHGFLLNQQRALEKGLELEGGEVDLTTLPTFALANLASGVTTVISGADRRSGTSPKPGAVVQRILQEGVDRIGAAPAFLERVVEECQRRSIKLPRVRKIFTGGGPVFPKLLDQLASVAPQAQIAALYGCTEAEPIALLKRDLIGRSDQTAMATGSGLLAGCIEPQIAVRIIPDVGAGAIGPWTLDEFDAASLLPGQAGEIVVNGPTVLRGYLDAGDDAKTKIDVAGSVWHRTGDAGYLDDNGRLWLLGRCCARIEDAHGKVYPLQIETAIRQQHQSCKAALVSNGGRRVLLVERRGSGETAGLAGILRRWRIDAVQYVRALPYDKRHRSKIDYSALARIRIAPSGTA
jgi:acyl-CoA synthetase (AMP-forming)/AMP-acid ligase II